MQSRSAKVLQQLQPVYTHIYIISRFIAPVTYIATILENKHNMHGGHEHIHEHDDTKKELSVFARCLKQVVK